uniref:Movement protein TGBp3 n=1 Tax=Papaya mosaic potexvirus TaxID=12181 RepID=A0A6B9KL38_PMV|nr:triple gene block 3 [Papaya mosaic virus]QHA79272.1 triple gene block 3 [Papaya mosaic virus]QHA79282.1 triple gene block 3 [Papaya mosaic virus]
MFSGREILLIGLTTLAALIVLNYLQKDESQGCLIILSGHSSTLKGQGCELLHPDTIKAMSAHLAGLRF